MWRKELFHFAMVCSQFALSRMNEARKKWMAMAMLQWHARSDQAGITLSARRWGDFLSLVSSSPNYTPHNKKQTETILLALCFDLSAEMHHYKGHRKSLVLSNSKKIFVYLKPGTQKVSSWSHCHWDCINWFASLVRHQLTLLQMLLLLMWQCHWHASSGTFLARTFLLCAI